MWLWHCAQPSVSPSQTAPVVFVRSTTASLRNCSRSLPPSCRLMLGQQVLATPMVRVDDAYRVPRSAVFRLERENYVLVRDGESLLAVAVTPLAAEAGDYVLQAADVLRNAEVLVSSVSAVQGILLGLGGE